MTNKTYTLYSIDGVRIAQLENSSIKNELYKKVVVFSKTHDIYDRDDALNSDIFDEKASELLMEMIDLIFQVGDK